MDHWQEERIFIWGKTRPELSGSYREVVCTGGIIESTGEMIRLYPIPLRYLNDNKIFAKGNIIRARIARTSKDPRPESRKIDFNSISVEDFIGTDKGTWRRRSHWVMRDPHKVQSVEQLQLEQKSHKRSLGIMKPKEIIEITFEQVKFDSLLEWKQRYEDILSQQDLPFVDDEKRNIKPIPPPAFKYKIKFTCDDSRCSTEHQFSVLDWEPDALFNNLRNNGLDPRPAAAEVVLKLQSTLVPSNDVWFFLGNISNHPQNFTIVGLWYPKQENLLFDA